MDSSHTLNAAISILFPLSTCLETLELSVSLDVKSTQMAEFTSMLSSCSNGSLSQEMSVYSMYMDATQMLSVVGVHRRRVGIMRRSMGTLLREDSKDPEVGFLRLALYGLQSSFRRIERAFLKLARDWLREHFCVTSLPSDVMPIGNIGESLNPTLTLQSYRSTQRDFQDSTHGYNKIWWSLELKVSVSCPSCLCMHGPSSLRSVPRRGARALLGTRGRWDMFSARGVYVMLTKHRTTKISNTVRTNENRQNVMGQITGTSRVFWRSILLRRVRG